MWFSSGKKSYRFLQGLRCPSDFSLPVFAFFGAITKNEILVQLSGGMCQIHLKNFWAAWVRKETNLMLTSSYIWVFPKIGVYPQNHPSKNKVFHYFHHPFWGKHPYSWKHPYRNRPDVFFSTLALAPVHPSRPPQPPERTSRKLTWDPPDRKRYVIDSKLPWVYF